MAATIADVLESARAEINSFTGEAVTLGAPDSPGPGLSLFPYRVSQPPHVRAHPGNPTGRETVWRVSCLLMPSTVDNFIALAEGMRWLAEQPVFAVGGDKVGVALSDLESEQLALIFKSAEVPLRLAVSFDLQWSHN